jgi:hypothetical protein
LIVLFLRTLLIIITATGLFAAVAGALAGTYLVASILVALSVSLSPFGSQKKPFIIIRGIIFVVAVVVPLSSPLIFVQEVQSRTDGMWRIVNEQGAEALPLNYKCAIWGGNIVMALGGAALGYPEAAKQTVYMIFNGPNKRVWESDFALSSPKVLEPLKWFSKNLPSKPTSSQIRMKPVSLAWRGYKNDRRVAFALNGPAKLSAEARFDGNDWIIKNSVVVPIRYPPKARVHLITIAGKPFYVEEGLFRALETVGWLHPYKAEWTWEMTANDILSMSNR